MSFTDVQIANMSLGQVGGDVVDELADKDDISLPELYALARDAVLQMYPWKFARKRDRLTAAGILDASAITIAFVDSDPDTMTDSSSALVTSGFEDGDVLMVQGSSSNNGSYAINTVTAGTLTFETQEEVTAESLVNDTNLKLYASPAYKWGYKYAKPSDCLRVLDVAGGDIGTWDIEGSFITTILIDSNDQVPITYTKQITDTAKFTDLFVKVLVKQLAAALVRPLEKDEAVSVTLLKEAQDVLFDGLAAMGSEGDTNERRDLTGWQKSGRELPYFQSSYYSHYQR